MDSPAVQTYLVGPAIKGAIAGIAGSYLVGGSAKVPLFGMSVSPAVLIGSSVGAASIISILSHDMVLQRIKGNRYADLETRFLAPALTAAASVAVGYATLGALDGRAIAELAGLGAASEIAGDYAHEMVKSAMNGGRAVVAHGM